MEPNPTERQGMLKFIGPLFSYSRSVHCLQLPWLGATRCRPTSAHNGEGNQGGHYPFDQQLTRGKTKRRQLFYVAEYFYAVSAAFIKCSIAVTLLRISAAHRSIEVSLWAVISMTCIAAIVFCAGIANICMVPRQTCIKNICLRSQAIRSTRSGESPMGRVI
jgi:hypothetical protein